MHFMVVCGFRNHDARAVYTRMLDEGRLIPSEDMKFVQSWATADLSRTFQVFECNDVTLLQRWVAAWADLCTFEILPVVTGLDAAKALVPRPS
jgi:hypothetical protein